MATITVIPATTSASTQTCDARAYESISVTCAGLAGAEKVAVKIGGGANWALVTQPDDSPTQLTATRQSIQLPGGYYQFIKDASVGSVSVEVNLICD